MEPRLVFIFLCLPTCQFPMQWLSHDRHNISFLKNITIVLSAETKQDLPLLNHTEPKTAYHTTGLSVEIHQNAWEPQKLRIYQAQDCLLLVTVQ